MTDPLPGDEDYVPPAPEPFYAGESYLVGAIYRTDSNDQYVVFQYPGTAPTGLDVAQSSCDTLNRQDAISRYGVGTTQTSDFYKVFVVPSIDEYREVTEN